MAQSKRAKVANYLCRLNFRSPLGAPAINDLRFWTRLGLKSVQYSRTKSPPSHPRGVTGKAHVSNFYPGPVRPGFPELRGSSNRGLAQENFRRGAVAPTPRRSRSSREACPLL